MRTCMPRTIRQNLSWPSEEDMAPSSVTTCARLNALCVFQEKQGKRPLLLAHFIDPTLHLYLYLYLYRSKYTASLLLVCFVQAVRMRYRLSECHTNSL